VVFVNLKDSTRAADVPDLWYQVRKKVGDIKQTLPQAVQGPFFNDEFGDTYALIFALTSDGFSHRELRTRGTRGRWRRSRPCGSSSPAVVRVRLDRKATSISLLVALACARRER
jgi:hypothetical protein